MRRATRVAGALLVGAAAVEVLAWVAFAAILGARFTLGPEGATEVQTFIFLMGAGLRFAVEHSPLALAAVRGPGWDYWNHVSIPLAYLSALAAVTGVVLAARKARTKLTCREEPE